MRPEVNSNRFESLNPFEKSFHLHGFNSTAANIYISNRFQKFFRLRSGFNVATFQTILRPCCKSLNLSF